VINTLSTWLCRYWYDTFSYTLKPPTDSYTGGSGFAINKYQPVNAAPRQYQVAEGYFSVTSVTVSGLLSPACIADVHSGISEPELLHETFKQVLTNTYTGILARFIPNGGINQAAADCDVAGFDWMTTVTTSAAIYNLQCANSTCSSTTPIPAGATVYDPPEYGWVYCYTTYCGYGVSPYYRSRAVAASPAAAQSFCIEYTNFWSLFGVSTEPGDLGTCVATLLTRLRGLGPFFVFGPLNINGLG
jgi:hypothetical protein